MDSATKKLNGVLFVLIITMLGFNSYMNTVELEAIQKHLDDKQLLCVKTFEIKSKHNVVLECSEVK